MAITLDFLKELGIEKDIAEKIFSERGKEIAAEKEERKKIQDELKTSSDNVKKITDELNELKSSNADAADWKRKFEDLQTEISEKEKEAAQKAAAAEKENNLRNRYASVCVGKDGNPLEWSHEAIKNDYFAKFTAAVEDKSNVGKSDAEIFHSLVKDDAVAFKNVQAIPLVGAKPLGMAAKTTRADILKIKDPIDRRKAIAENIDLFNKEE